MTATPARSAVRVASPTLRNNLPIAVKTYTSLYLLCRLLILLKGHLFRHAFGWSPVLSGDLCR